MLIKLKGLRLERLRDFGDVWLALGLWRLVGLDTLLDRLLPAGREEVPWPAVAAILTPARFCEPSSALHIEDTWYRRTALDDLLGVPVEAVHTDRLYAGLDQLLPHKEALERHLQQRLGDLFDLSYELLRYDVTSTYFEGLGAGNPLARRGYSRDSRPDCPQVCIGPVVTTDGIPLGYEVFAGNTNDARTIPTIVEAMERKYGKANRTWVLDRGMVSEANLQLLRDRGGSYIVGTPRALLRQFERHLTDRDGQEVQAGVEVKLVPGPNGDETFLLARSVDRREKEKAMHQRFLERMEAQLVKLRASAEHGRLHDLTAAHQRLGRLKERYWRVAGAFEVKIQPVPHATSNPDAAKQCTRCAGMCAPRVVPARSGWSGAPHALRSASRGFDRRANGPMRCPELASRRHRAGQPICTCCAWTHALINQRVQASRAKTGLAKETRARKSPPMLHETRLTAVGQPEGRRRRMRHDSPVRQKVSRLPQRDPACRQHHAGSATVGQSGKAPEGQERPPRIQKPLDAVECVVYTTHMSRGFGEYVRQRREALRKDHPEFSVRQLASRIDVEPSYLSKIERGEQPPPSEATIRRLAQELGEDVDVLLAMAGKVSRDLQEIVRKRPQLFGELIRELSRMPDKAVLRLVREVRDGDW